MKKKKRARNSLDEMRLRYVESETESNHRTVKNQERKIAESLGGKRRDRRGRTASDGFSKKYEIECKQTAKDSMSIKREWIKKITEAAQSRGRSPLMSIKFLNMPIGYDEHWVMVPARDFFERIEDGD